MFCIFSYEGGTMKKIDIANGVVFQKFNISKDSFDTRLLAQKKIYLLQSLGTNLGYEYNWYLRGPYSPSLSNYIYNNLEVLGSYDFSDYTITDKAKNDIESVVQLETEKGQDIDSVQWYELLASLMFIYRNNESWKITKNDEDVYRILMTEKPKYNREQCERAYKTLVDKNFLRDN